jgi:hypothetical protein
MYGYHSIIMTIIAHTGYIVNHEVLIRLQEGFANEIISVAIITSTAAFKEERRLKRIMFDQNHNHATNITTSNIGNNTTTTNNNYSSSNNNNNNIINDSNSNNIRSSGSKNVKNKFRNFSKKIYFRSTRYDIMLMK